MDKRRLHPYSILESFPQFALFSLIPFLQSAAAAPLSGSAWKSLFWAMLPFLPAILVYLASSYSREDGFCFRRGILLRRCDIIPDADISSAEIHTTLIALLTGASFLRLDTPAGRGIRLTLPITRLRRADTKGWRRRTSLPAGRILLAAAAWSSPASGLMFTGLALQRAGRILGEEFSRPVYDTVSRGFRIAILGIPPAVTGIGVLLAIGWLIALLRDFLKYAGFTVWTRPNGLMFLRGLLHRREYVRKSAVRAAVFQQTLPLYLMRRGVLSLYPAGKGKRGASPLLLPRLCRDPFPKSTVRPSLRSLPSYLTLPGILLLLALVLIWLVDSRLIASLLLPLLIPAGWLAAFRTASWHRAGIAVRSGRIFLHGFHRMRLYTAAIPIGEIRQIRLIQNPFQQCSGTCTVRLYAGTAAQQFFEVKQIDMKQARAILFSCEREH